MQISTRYKSIILGAFFGLLIVAELAAFTNTPGDISNYLVFVLGVFFFYLLLIHRFKNFWLSLLGSVLLVLTPNVFAQSFHFSMDIAFMTTFIIALYVGVLFAEHKETWLAVLTALASAFLIDMKIAGFLFPILLIDVFFLNGYKKEDKRFLSLYLASIAVFALLMLLFFGHNIFANFTLLSTANEFSASLPWFYPLRLVAITTPIAYLILALLGVWYFIEAVPNATREELFVGGWLAAPLILATLVRSHLFDIWGQMFFIYPCLLYFAIFALAKSSPRIKTALLILLAINVCFVLLFLPQTLVSLTPSI